MRRVCVGEGERGGKGGGLRNPIKNLQGIKELKVRASAPPVGQIICKSSSINVLTVSEPIDYGQASDEFNQQLTIEIEVIITS